MTQQQPTYKTDFYGWAKMEAQLLRERKLNELDFDNLIEEIEDMSGSTRRELKRRLSVLMAHLLKCQFQPKKRGSSWQKTLNTQREELKQLLEENPSLKYEMNETLLEAYKLAISRASDDTGLDKSKFPKECPYTFDQVMDPDFLRKDQEA